MRIVLEIFLILLYFSYILGLYLYFRETNPLKQYESPLKYLKALKLTRYLITAKGNRVSGIIHQS